MLLEYDINSYEFKNDNSTFILYYRDDSQFSKTTLHNFLRYCSFFVQNYVCGLILIVVNVIIYIRIKKLIKSKKKMQTCRNNSNLERTVRSIKIMLYANSATTIIFRIPRMIYFVFNDILHKKIFDNIIHEYSTLILFFFISFSITIRFFLYYLTNNLFRHVFNQMIRRMFMRNIVNVS
jgi:hypothetical protein